MGRARKDEEQQRAGTRRVLMDSRHQPVELPPAAAFRPIQQIGGDSGWYSGNLLWRLRGLIDLLFGGPGPVRRRYPGGELAPGHLVDAWRVEALEPNRLLLLRAEMKLPGEAWLRFEVAPAVGGSDVRQTAIFYPTGVPGLLYWYLLLPVHQIMFRGMLRGIVNEARRRR